MEVQLCLEEMAAELPGVVAQEVAEVWEEEVEVVAGWGAPALGLAPVGIVFAPIAELECPIR